jgi:hypothetical protein
MKTAISRLVATLLLVIPVSLAVSADNAAKPGAVLTSQIEYRFVGHEQQVDDDGRLLVWEATITGDITGTMKWWFEQPPPVAEQVYEGGRVSFYAARWEVFADDKLVLAGFSAGKTVFPDGEDGIWDGHGVVTDAVGRFNALKGGEIYETGPVLLGEEPPITFAGTGLFQVYQEP